MNAPQNKAAFDLGGDGGEDRFATSFSILLLPGFSLLCLSALVEPLRLANRLSRRRVFGWRLTSLDGQPVESAGGIAVEVAGQPLPPPPDRPAALLICAGDGVETQTSPELRGLLRRVHRENRPIYALGTASWLLADASLLGQRPCTIHWSKMAALAETFDAAAPDDALFVRAGNIVTCAGGLAAFDLAIATVRERCGVELARGVCQHLNADRWRDGSSGQAAPPGLRVGRNGAALLRVIKLMESHIEDPLPLETIAARVRLSRRQVERLFERHLSTTPRRYYATIKLRKARQLIELTDMPVTDVAMACGFVSPSHFSKSFKSAFGASPSRMKAC